MVYERSHQLDQLDPFDQLDQSDHPERSTSPKQSCQAGTSVLAIGDPHFRLEQLEQVGPFTRQIEHVIRTEQPDWVVVLGDLLHCHERLHTSVLNKAYQFIHRLRSLVPVYILVGNHDYINNSQFLSTNHWMNAMKYWENVYVVDEGMVHDTPSGRFIFCPYVSPGEFERALTQIDSQWQHARAIFCHQEFKGCKMGALISEEGDVWHDTYPFVISGHIHDRQQVGENILYTGSAMQHAFGESSDKTVSVCRFNSTLQIDHIHLFMPRKEIHYLTMDELRTYTPPPSNVQVRVTVTGSFEEFKTFRKSTQYQTLTKHGVKIVYRHQPTEEELAPTETKQTFHDLLQTLIRKDPQADALWAVYQSLPTQ
jgi:DNA repair exonuclease SbcCD nuclease subunit